MKAVSYLRYSSLASTDSDSLVRQRQAIQSYADKNGIEIVEEFKDEGVPGTTEMRNRAGLAACMARVETNGVELVLVETADRLARDAMVSELIIREFQKADVTVISANGGVDLTAGNDDNPTAKLVRQILASVAEFDRCVIVLKMRAARERIREKGEKCEGRKPFGARDGERKTLQEILTQYERGMGPKMIAHWLNSNGIPARYGKWHPGTISRILNRHKYTATIPLSADE